MNGCDGGLRDSAQEVEQRNREPHNNYCENAIDAHADPSIVLFDRVGGVPPHVSRGKCTWYRYVAVSRRS